MEREECKKVQVLLKNYAKNSVDKETKEYIEEHVKICNTCKKMLKQFQKNTNEENKSRSFKIKIIVIAILLIILIPVIMISRKIIIISNLENKSREYVNSNNFYAKVYSYSGDFTNINEHYKKDDKQLTKNRIFNGTYVSDFIYVKENEKTDIYANIDGKKVANLDEDIDLFFMPNTIEINNIWELMDISMYSKVETEECNGKNCYRISNKYCTLYLDKDTGLIVREIRKFNEGDTVNMVLDYMYTFDNVKDTDFNRPNISEYTMQ